MIERCGDIGMVEMIVSEILTRAIYPNCYFPELKQYGFVDADLDQVFYFDENSNQYLKYKSVEESKHEYVMLIDLKAELLEVQHERI